MAARRRREKNAKMNEVLPQKLIVISEEEYNAFCRLESIAHLEIIVLHPIDLTWCEAIARRFDRAKTEALRLEWIELRFMGWYSGYVPIIEAIGRLQCRLNLCIGFFRAVDIDYGNIGGLYWRMGIATQSRKNEMTTWFLEQLPKTRIQRAGIWFDYTVVDFKDDYAVACDILAAPDSLMHSIDTYYPDYAFMLRRHAQCMDALQKVRVRFGVCCKRKGIPRDIMRIIVAHLSPKDWEDTVKTSKSHKWVKDTLKKYRTMQDKNKEAAFWFGRADRAMTTEEHEDAKKCQHACEKEVQFLTQELREIQKRWTTNKFGVRVMGPRKKLKV